MTGNAGRFSRSVDAGSPGRHLDALPAERILDAGWRRRRCAQARSGLLPLSRLHFALTPGHSGLAGFDGQGLCLRLPIPLDLPLGGRRRSRVSPSTRVSSSSRKRWAAICDFLRSPHTLSANQPVTFRPLRSMCTNQARSSSYRVMFMRGPMPILRRAESAACWELAAWTGLEPATSDVTGEKL
jgi:hypothetical protein